MPTIRIHGKPTMVLPPRNAQPAQKTAFYKVGDGFVLGHHRGHGTAIKLTERQAKYLLLEGKISATKPVGAHQAPAPLGGPIVRATQPNHGYRALAVASRAQATKSQIKPLKKPAQ